MSAHRLFSKTPKGSTDSSSLFDFTMEGTTKGFKQVDFDRVSNDSEAAAALEELMQTPDMTDSQKEDALMDDAHIESE